MRGKVFDDEELAKKKLVKWYQIFRGCCTRLVLVIMPVYERMLERLRELLRANKIEWLEKKMFGGTCFMVDDKMCFGTYRGGLMARVDPDQIDEYVKRNGAEQTDP